MLSINTNIGAMMALQTLSQINREMAQVQNRLSTGLRVSSPADDGAAFAVAQGLRGDIKAYEAVNERLNFSKGVVDVALTATTSVSDTLNDYRATLTKLADDSLSADQRSQYEAQAQSQLDEMQNFVRSASFNGRNLLQTGASDSSVITGIRGESYSIGAHDLETAITALAAPGVPRDLLDGTDTRLDDLEAVINTALTGFGADRRRIDNQIGFNERLRDAKEAGLGAIVDADLARESARLQSLQVKQQLAIQALGIANQSSQLILQLFR